MEIRADASLTHGPPLDIDLAPGQRASDAAGAGELWCGGVALSPDHQAGEWPLIDGAVLTAAPAPWSVTPRGPHLAVVSGPDAGWLLPVTPALRLGGGSAGVRAAFAPRAAMRWSLADPAIDRDHVVISRTQAGARWEDLGSVNGTGIMRGTTVTRRRRGDLGEGDLLAVGRSALELRLDDREQRPAVRLPARWHGDIELEGPCALASARAVVLARGGIPSVVTGEGAAGLLAEPWLRWLPPEPDEHGALTVSPSKMSGDTAGVPALAVSPQAAELAARVLASAGEPSVGRTLHWGDLPPVPASEVAWGRASGGELVTWRPWDPGSLALVTGGPGTGATTALVTAVSAITRSAPPSDVEVVIIAPGGGQRWARLIASPHVRAAVVTGSESEASAALHAPAHASRRLVVVDGADRFATRSVAALATTLPATRGDAVALSTSRVAGVFTPRALASAAIVMALRGADPAASLDVVSGAHALTPPGLVPGLASVRSDGRTRLARLAHPGG